MRELLKNAWLGWQNYTDEGKLAALLLAALLFLWLSQKQKKQRALLTYAAVMTVCCIFPVTAALLMLYQTRFYDYQWIWSMVPATIVTAYGITEFLTDKRIYGENGEKRRKSSGDRFLPIGVVALTAAVVILCGNLGQMQPKQREAAEAEQEYGELLLALTDNGQNNDICLWAPQEVMEYARIFNGHISLPYGRNMWDKALGAYSYDSYSQEDEELYRWMSGLEVSGSFDICAGQDGEQPVLLSGEACMNIALSKGVNCILLPTGILQETLERAENVLGVHARELGEYYLFSLKQSEGI